MTQEFRKLSARQRARMDSTLERQIEQLTHDDLEDLDLDRDSEPEITGVHDVPNVPGLPENQPSNKVVAGTVAAVIAGLVALAEAVRRILELYR